MRILFLSGLYPPQTRGGGELSTHYIALGLRQRDHHVTVISSASDATRRETVSEGVSVIRIPSAFTAKPLFEQRWATRQARLLADELARHKPFDIIHCHDFRTAQVVAALNLPNAVVTVRDYAFICGSPNNILADGSPCPGCERLSVVLKNRSIVEAPFWRKPFRAWQYWHNIDFRKATLQSFQHQIFISQAQQTAVRLRLPQAGVHETVIYNPLAPSYVTTRPVRTVGHTLLYVGTVESYKGVGLLLDAFKNISQSWPQVHLKIVGEGAQRSLYEQQVAQWGLRYRVSFAGRINPDRMLLSYDDAALVVVPHVWEEPFGRTVVEGMARERVVIAARAGGPGEIIQDGVTGLLFERGSREELEQVLERALKMSEIDRREMQRAARAWTLQQLTVDTIARQYEEFYHQLAK